LIYCIFLNKQPRLKIRRRRKIVRQFPKSDGTQTEKGDGV